jgi:hypothetical protein
MVDAGGAARGAEDMVLLVIGDHALAATFETSSNK